ncbi:MAG TPA: hypothetical protein VHK91_00865 [Flavisolibacter sp.]|jgi:hypothetical protein|nr:hypothetical protein [Flavisolibacter sp.]
MMKYVYLLLVLATSLTSRAQQPFQGMVVYNLKATGDSKEPELEISFGPQKIKVRFKENSDYDRTYLLLDLDSGRIYTINSESKTYSYKKLYESKAYSAPDQKMIAGLKTEAIRFEGKAGLEFLRNFMNGNTLLYAAKDLYYPIPDRFKEAPELIMIQKNHIVLGADLAMSNPFGGGEEDSTKRVTITVEAKRIDSAALSPEALSIPQGFELATIHSQATYDTTEMTTTDTTMMQEMPPPPPVKKKAVPRKPVTPPTKTTKGEATKKRKT